MAVPLRSGRAARHSRCLGVQSRAAVPASQVRSYRPGPPPAAEGYAAPEALCPDPSAHRWSLLWSADGESMAVLRDGVALALIARARPPGYSRLLIRSGPWGAVWDEELFRQLMQGPAEAAAPADQPRE